MAEQNRMDELFLMFTDAQWEHMSLDEQQAAMQVQVQAWRLPSAAVHRRYRAAIESHHSGSHQYREFPEAVSG